MAATLVNDHAVVRGHGQESLPEDLSGSRVVLAGVARLFFRVHPVRWIARATAD